MNAFDFSLPGRLAFGPGRFSELGELCAPLGKKALIVTCCFGAEAGLTAKAKEALAAAGISSVAWSGVVPNPTLGNVEEAASLAREQGCDLVIGIGGGSSMDTAKAAAVAAVHEGDAWDYIMGGREVTDATLPIVAVPTTSGTGSHVTCFAVVTNPETNEKPGMGSPHIIPRLAVLDPELTNGAPHQLTLNTGFDVFAHALEAYTSQAASPISDMFARKAIEDLAEALPRCLADGADLEARGAMMVADTCAGAAICAAVVSVGHALAHVVSGHFPEIAHGDALYAVYRPLLAFNARAMPEKHQWVAGCLKPGCTDIVAAFDEFFGVHSFVNALRSAAPDDAMLDRLVDDVWRYLKFAVDLNPRPATQADLRDLLAAAIA